MDNILRIHEITRNGHVAEYNNVELGTALNIQRGTVKAALSRPGPASGELECVTFVPNTFHNRCYFLQNINAEASERIEDKWVVISRDWLQVAFKPAEGSAMFREKAKEEPAAAPPQGKEESPGQSDQMITTIDDFLKLSKSMQVSALNALIEAEVPEEFRRKLITDISISQDSNLAVKAKEQADKYLEE